MSDPVTVVSMTSSSNSIQPIQLHSTNMNPVNIYPSARGVSGSVSGSASSSHSNANLNSNSHSFSITSVQASTDMHMHTRKHPDVPALIFQPQPPTSRPTIHSFQRNLTNAAPTASATTRLSPTYAYGEAQAAATPAAAASASASVPSSVSSYDSSQARFYYKLVARVGPDRYVSIFDGVTEYTIGCTVQCDMKPNDEIHTDRSIGPRSARIGRRKAGWRYVKPESLGGIFVCRTVEDALAARIPDESALAIAPRVLMKVLAWGPSRELNHGKTMAFTFVRPVQVYPLTLGYRCAFVGSKQLTCVQRDETRKRLPPFLATTHPTQLPSFTQRNVHASLSHRISGMNARMTQLTRAQLGW